MIPNQNDNKTRKGKAKSGYWHFCRQRYGLNFVHAETLFIGYLQKKNWMVTSVLISHWYPYFKVGHLVHLRRHTCWKIFLLQMQIVFSAPLFPSCRVTLCILGFIGSIARSFMIGNINIGIVCMVVQPTDETENSTSGGSSIYEKPLPWYSDRYNSPFFLRHYRYYRYKTDHILFITSWSRWVSSYG